MAFRIEYIGGFNPFEWEALGCPVCGSSDFVSQDHIKVYCDRCWAEFRVRPTAGDPGCVVDCFVKEIYAPLWECKDCGERAGFFDWQEPVCPADPIHSMRDESHDGRIRKLWEPPRDFPKSFYLILKLGDYCSGWLDGENCEQFHIWPTQEQWECFQEEARMTWSPFGQRWATLRA